MYFGVLAACMSGRYNACSALKGQKRASDFMELELQMVVSGHLGAGN